MGSTEKLNIVTCTTTNLPLSDNTIIVLKITLFYSVSVITNFVIPKRDKNTRNEYASPPRGNAIPDGPLSDSDEILCCCGIPIGPLC